MFASLIGDIVVITVLYYSHVMRSKARVLNARDSKQEKAERQNIGRMANFCEYKTHSFDISYICIIELFFHYQV